MRQIRRSIARYYLIARKVWGKLFPASISVSTPMATSAIPIRTLQELVVIITGSSRGIGFALAKSFLQTGASVVLNARDAKRLEAAAEQLGRAGDSLISIAADVSTASGAQTLAKAAIDHFGKVDVLINNAGIMGPLNKHSWEISQQDWESVMSANLMSAVNCSSKFAKLSIANNHPLRIINVSSGIVGHGMKGLGPYAVSKDAIEGLTRSYGCDSVDGPVSVCSIQPRSVRSEMTKRYFDSASYALMNETDAVTEVFLWAATAAPAEVQGRTFSDPLFAADPAAARSMRGPLAGSQRINVNPTTFSDDSDLDQQPGAYMHLLENAHGFYPSVAENLDASNHNRALYSYPDPNYQKLKQCIALEAGIELSQIAIGAGSSEIINRLLSLFTCPGDHVVVTRPTWSFFQAFMQKWRVVPSMVPMLGSMKQGDMKHDLQGLLAEIKADTRLVYLVNPCNPTGTMLARSELEQFVMQIPSHVILVLDEAYIQYSDPGNRPDLVKLIESCPGRIIVLRTFSKFFGLSGLRVGFACGSDETIRLLASGEVPFAITAPAAQLVPTVLGDKSFQQQVFDSNLEGRKQLTSGLGELGLPFLPSQTNFILFDCPVDPQQLRNDLLAEGLVLPNVDQFLQNYATLAVGLAHHNELLLQALAKY